jgi:hypothetical protein
LARGSLPVKRFASSILVTDFTFSCNKAGARFRLYEEIYSPHRPVVHAGVSGMQQV